VEQRLLLYFLAIPKQPLMFGEKDAVETHSYGMMRSGSGAKDLATVQLKN
jgi:hypothetical protein